MVAVVEVINSGGGSISMSDCFRAWSAELHCGAHRGARRCRPAGGTPDTI